MGVCVVETAKLLALGITSDTWALEMPWIDSMVEAS